MIHQVPQLERPRERCLTLGAHSLSIRECLALIIGSGPPGEGCLGLAHKIVSRPGEGLGIPEQERAFFTAMESSPQSALSEIHGLGEASRARLLAAFELGRRYAQFRNNQNSIRRIPAPSELTQQALEKINPALRAEAKEWIGFLPFYRNGELGELCIVEKGVRTHVNVDPTEFFARLLALRPAGFFLSHNHPSGNPTPSPQDFELTKKVSDLARDLGIRHLGHWIVSEQSERLIGMEFP
jgi:DNA repair protein RadC